MPEYWIVDLVGGAIEVRRGPHGDGYATVTRHTNGAMVAIPGFDDVLVPVSEIVPSR